MQTENTPLKSDNDFAWKDGKLELPEEFRSELKSPLGEVVLESQLIEALEDIDFIVTVGDLCSLTLYELDIIPDIAVVDYSTRRGNVGDKREIIGKIGQSVINVNNPPGVITWELWYAVQSAYQSEVPVRIEVTGEEDLATLAAVWFAKERTAVIYGLPHVGLVMVTDMKDARKKVQDVLVKMI